MDKGSGDCLYTSHWVAGGHSCNQQPSTARSHPGPSRIRLDGSAMLDIVRGARSKKEGKEKARALGHRHLINMALPDRPAVTTPYLFQRGRSVLHVDVEVDRMAARARSVSPTSAFPAMGHHTTQSTDESSEPGPEPFRSSALSDGGAGTP